MCTRRGGRFDGGRLEPIYMARIFVNRWKIIPLRII